MTAPWGRPKDRSGESFITIKGVRYRVEGTGWTYQELAKKVREGEAIEVERGEGDA